MHIETKYKLSLRQFQLYPQDKVVPNNQFPPWPFSTLKLNCVAHQFVSHTCIIKCIAFQTIFPLFVFSYLSYRNALGVLSDLAHTVHELVYTVIVQHCMSMHAGSRVH